MILQEGFVPTTQGAIWTAIEPTRLQLLHLASDAGSQTVKVYVRKAGKPPRKIRTYTLELEESAPIGELDFNRGDSIEAIATSASGVHFTVHGVPIAKLEYLVHGGFKPTKWNSAGAEIIEAGTASGGTGGGTVTGFISAGTEIASLGTVYFINSNGLTWGMNNSSITGSYTVPSTAGLLSNIRVSASGTSLNLSAITFANSNGVTFGLSNNSVMTASVNTGVASINVSAGTTSNSVSAITFANSNGFAFGLSTGAGVGTITGSYTVPTQTVQTQNVHNVTLSGNTSGAMAQISSGTMTLAGGNNITLSQAGNAVTIFGPTTSAQQTGISGIAGSNTTYTSGTVLFSGVGGGITVSSNTGQRIDLSVAAQVAQTNQTGGIYFTGAQTSGQSSSSTHDLRTLSISGQGIVSAGWSNSSILINATQSNQAVSGTNGSLAFQTLSLGTITGSSHVTFYTTNGSIVGSFSVPAQTVQTQNCVDVVISGNTSGVTALVSSGTLTLAGGNNITLSQAGNAITISGPNAGGAQTGISGLANSQVTYTSGTVSFSELGAITIRSTTGQQFQFSVNPQSVQPGIQSIAFGNTTFTTGAISFSDANGFSFGSSGGQVTASYTVPTQTVQTQNLHNVTLAGNSTSAGAGFIQISSGTMTLAGGANIMLSQNGNAVTISASAAAGDGANIIAAGTQTANTTGTVAFSSATNANVVFGMSNSSVVTANATIGFSGGTNSSGLSSLRFSDANNVSWSIVAGSGIVANAPIRITAGVGSGSVWSLSLANSNGISFGYASTTGNSGTLTAQFANTFTAGQAGASTTFTGRDLYFSNANGVSFGLAGSTLTATVAAGGGGLTNINISAGTTSNLGSAFTFADSGIHFGLNGSVITAQPAPLSYYENVPLVRTQLVQATSFGQSTSHAAPFLLPYPLSASYIRFIFSNNVQSTIFATSAGNTSFSASILHTFNAVIYSLGNGASSRSMQSVGSVSTGMSQRISLQASGISQTVLFSYTYPGLAGASSTHTASTTLNTSASYNIASTHLTNFVGNHFFDMPFVSSLSAGLYFLLLGESSATSTQGNAQLSQARIASLQWWVASQANSAISPLGQVANASNQIQPGLGSFTRAGGGTTASINLSQISSNVSHVRPYFQILRIE